MVDSRARSVVGTGSEVRADVVRMVAKIAVIIFALETAIMVIFSNFDFSAYRHVEDVLDSALLTVTASPLIYFGVAQPFVNAARAANLRIQEQLNENLESFEAE